jgi:SAM-dependent methyltransferase
MKRKVFGNVLRSIREEGVLSTSRNLALRLIEKYYERRLGIDSLEAVSLDEMQLTDRQYHRYTATDFLSFQRIMKAVSIAPGRDVFLDYGAGKGRVLVMAATRPFAKVIGIEFSAELATLAHQNVARARPRLCCSEVEVITRDAREYCVPGEVTHVYFFNPFHGEILDAVLDRLHDSLMENPRPLFVLSHYPVSGLPLEAQLGRCTWLVRHHEIALRGKAYAALYRNLGATTRREPFEAASQNRNHRRLQGLLVDSDPSG